MRQIRNSVFETNSSSMHSLVIKKDECFEENESLYYSEEEIKNNFKWYIKGSVLDFSRVDLYFGRAPFRILDDAFEKVQYALASNYELEDVIKVLNEYFPKLKSIKLSEWCGVDDYSLSFWLKKRDIDLREFLLNKRYIVICDGDEYCIWDDMKSSGIIDVDSFEEVR